MAQIINDPGRAARAGSEFGQSLGQGLGSLAQYKLNQVLERNQFNQGVNALKNLGVEEPWANYINSLPPQQQLPILLQYGQAASSRQQQNPTEIAQGPISQYSQSQALQQPSAINDLVKSLGASQQTNAAQFLEPNAPISELLRNALSRTQFSQNVEQQLPMRSQPKVEQAPPVIAPVAPTQQQAKLAQPVVQPQRNLTVQDIVQTKQQPKEEIKRLSDEKKQAQKDTKKVYEDVIQQEKAASDSDKRLNRMEQLIKKGDLPFSAFYKLVTNLEENVKPEYAAGAGAAAGGIVGGPIGAAIGGTIGGLIQPVASLLRYVQRYTSPDTEEFEKLSNDFIKDAKGIFGARITDADLRAFMQTIPTLSQTDGGKLNIIRNLKSFNEAAHVRSKVMKQLLKETGGERPADFALQIEERATPKLDEIANKFTLGQPVK